MRYDASKRRLPLEVRQSASPGLQPCSTVAQTGPGPTSLEWRRPVRVRGKPDRNKYGSTRTDVNYFSRRVSVGARLAASRTRRAFVRRDSWDVLCDDSVAHDARGRSSRDGFLPSLLTDLIPGPVSPTGEARPSGIAIPSRLAAARRSLTRRNRRWNPSGSALSSLQIEFELLSSSSRQ